MRAIQQISNRAAHWVLIGLLCFLTPSGSSHAALSWKEEALMIPATTFEKEVKGQFHFVNSGTTAVRIRSLKTSCGCTAAKLEKKVYEPGERGILEATFHFSRKQGLQRRLITIVTEEPARSEKVLSIGANVALPLEISPLFVYWQRMEPNTPKTVNLHRVPQLQVEGVNSTNPLFSATLEGQERIRINCGSTNEAAKGEILVRTSYPGKKPETHKVHLRIK